MTKGKIGAIVLAIVVIFTVIILCMCTVKIPAGYIGVKYNMSGGIAEDTLSQGFHIVSPMTKVTLYSVGLEQSYLTSGNQGDSEDDESFSASSSEGKALQIDLTFSYQYPAENVVSIFNRFRGQSGKEVRDSFIKPNIISWSKEVIARYKVSDILGEKRAEVNTALSEYLGTKFETYGISITNVSLINIEVDEETQEAINNKITAQQNAETQSINNQTAIDKATADATVKTTTAQADADAKLIAAEAEAQANKEIAESLTSELIEKIKYEQWNGELPKVSGSSGTIINMDDLEEEDETE